MFPESLWTNDLIMRPVAPGDAGAIFDEYAQDPEVARFTTWTPHAAIAETEAYIARCIAATSTRTYVLLGRRDRQLRGALELRRPAPSRMGFGYVLSRRSWGQGLMTEALTEAAGWALKQDGIWRFGDVCDVDNLASARVMEKAGLTREGLLRRWLVHPNIDAAPRDCWSFSRTR